jgi:hypothetical protein
LPTLCIRTLQHPNLQAQSLLALCLLITVYPPVSVAPIRCRGITIYLLSTVYLPVTVYLLLLALFLDLRLPIPASPTWVLVTISRPRPACHLTCFQWSILRQMAPLFLFQKSHQIFCPTVSGFLA